LLFSDVLVQELSNLAVEMVEHVVILVAPMHEVLERMLDKGDCFEMILEQDDAGAVESSFFAVWS